jgi:hypothetical protein
MPNSRQAVKITRSRHHLRPHRRPRRSPPALRPRSPHPNRFQLKPRHLTLRNNLCSRQRLEIHSMMVVNLNGWGVTTH